MDLGVKLEFPRGIFFRAFEETLIQKAKGVKLGSLKKASSSPSPWFFLINQWEKMGLPAILYGIEATSISASGINIQYSRKNSRSTYNISTKTPVELADSNCVRHGGIKTNVVPHIQGYG